MNESNVGSKASGSEDEPLVPDDFDDEFYATLLDKVPEITKALRQKDTPDNADNVQRLVICCNRYKSDFHTEQLRSQELCEEISKLQDRLESAANLSKLDQDTISELRTVIESAWKQKDAAQSREQIAQDEVMKLREKIEVLQDTIQELSEKRTGLQSKRDDAKEREALNAEIRDLNKRLQIQRLYITEVETMTQTLEEKNKSLAKLLDETSSEAFSNKKRADQLQTELNQLKSEQTKCAELLAQLKLQNEKLTKIKVRQNLQILSLKTNLEHLNTQYNATCNKLAKLTVDLEYAIQERDRNKRNLVQRTNLLKVREDEIIKLKQEKTQVTKSMEDTARKYSSLNDAKQTAEEGILRLKTQMNTQDKELEGMRRLVHHFEKNTEQLIKERDALKRDLLAKRHATNEYEERFQQSQQEIKTLKDTINQLELKSKKSKEEYVKLQNEKAKKIDEIQTHLDKLAALQNEISLKENYEIEMKRTISDLEGRCSKLSNLHDLLVSEKNTLQRNLLGCDDEKSRLKEQIISLESCIEMLKDKVSSRESEISKLQLQIDKMEKERRMLKTQIRYTQLGQQHARSELLEKKKDNDRFIKSLQEDDKKVMRLKKELDKIMDEKNAVCAALTKRTEECNQLKDNLSNLQTTYDITEKHFSKCQDDMRLMRIEIKNLRTERDVLRKDRESAADLRQELLQMHRVLNQERIKARALQEEMVTPMNIHRWRNLKGRDPEKMDLICRIQALRKQILNQNVVVLEHERAFQEAQQLYAALKEFMLKLPSHKVKEELNAARANLSSKDRKLKAVMAELYTKEVDDKLNTTKIEELKASLANVSTELMQERKKKQKLLEERQIFVQMQAQCFSAPPSMQRTLGAGFKIVGGF